MPAFFNAPEMATAPSLGALTPLRAPPKLPIGVRTALTMTTSFMLLVLLFGFLSFTTPLNY
ncbi:MAG: Uncharacterised protein [Cryomorphaceae bacterium]|nr:MAG: Uncharacterised protein [Cryomorphaceae bacterium]